jgi:hypothetical protein
MKPIYIIGPYHDNPSQWVERLTHITRLVSESERGHEVVIMCPHPMIHTNAYGDKVKAMTQSLNAIMMAATFDESELWIVLDDNGQYSSGVELELEMWKMWRDDYSIHEMRYCDWIQYLEMVWLDDE